MRRKYLEIIDEKTLNCLIKLVEYDADICGGISDCFNGKREQNGFIKTMKKTMRIPQDYIFDVWDLIGLHGVDALSKEDRLHIEYLYAQGTDDCVERAKEVKEEWERTL